MRILYFTAEDWPTYRADVAVLFGKYLPKHGIFSDIVTGQTPFQKSACWGGGNAFLYEFRGGQTGRYLKSLIHAVKQLIRCNRFAYHSIQVRDMPLLALLALIAARLKRLHFYYWMSYPMPEGQVARARERGLRSGIIRFVWPWLRGHIGGVVLYRLVLPNADHIFVQSEKMKSDVGAHRIVAEKITPVPMGVDLNALHSGAIQRADDPRLAGRRPLVYLGTLDWPRRIEKLFDMLAIVKRTQPKAMLILVGDTTDTTHRDWLKEYAQKAGISEDVLWTGWLQKEDAWRYVQAAEVGLSPFPRGFLLDSASPTKVPEYLALGIPVVCNDNPDQEAIIRESGAGKCVNYLATEFSEAVIELMQAGESERQVMAQRGRKFITENRDYCLIAAMLARVYEGLELRMLKTADHPVIR